MLRNSKHNYNSGGSCTEHTSSYQGKGTWELTHNTPYTGSHTEKGTYSKNERSNANDLTTKEHIRQNASCMQSHTMTVTIHSIPQKQMQECTRIPSSSRCGQTLSATTVACKRNTGTMYTLHKMKVHRRGLKVSRLHQFRVQ